MFSGILEEERKECAVGTGLWMWREKKLRKRIIQGKTLEIKTKIG